VHTSAKGNTQHAFTNPQANDPKLGLIYDATAERRAWLSMQNFLSEIFSG
jgi:dienelactone hydrolase